MGDPVESRTYARGITEPSAEPNPKRIRGLVDGVAVVDSTDTVVLRGGRLPVYGIPPADIEAELLEASEGSREMTDLGRVQRFTLELADRRLERAAWTVADPPSAAPDLAGYVMVEFDAMDTWLEEDDRIQAHPPDPYHRIDVRRSSREVEIDLGGERLAVSSRPVLLFETGLPTRFYLPRADVEMGLLEPSETVTQCAYKGAATHYHAAIDGERFEDVAWSYRQPQPAYGGLQDLVCFYQERVDRVVVDGDEQGPVETPWS